MARTSLTFIPPLLTFALGLALGHAWQADRSASSPADGAAPETAHAVPSGTSTRPGTPANLPAAGSATKDPQAPSPEAARAKLESELAEARGEIARLRGQVEAGKAAGGSSHGAESKAVDPAAAQPPVEASEENAGAAKMLKALFTSPQFRDTFAQQLVEQVEPVVKFTPEQRAAAHQGLLEAMKPLTEVLATKDVPLKDLDPLFQTMKENWKQKLDSSLTVGQRLAFQKWLEEKHSLSVGVGMDSTGAFKKEPTPTHDPGPEGK